MKPLFVTCAWTVALTSFLVHAAESNESNDLIAWWRFESVGRQTIDITPPSHDHDEDEPSTRVIHVVHDEVSGSDDQLTGFHALVPGAVGNALRFGGIGTFVARSAEAAPRLAESFTVEAWVALGAYPVNWCPILAQMDNDRGIFLGIDAYGHVGGKLKVNGEWIDVTSSDRISLGKWALVALTYHPDNAMRIYLDGKLVAQRSVEGELNRATDADLLIGKHPTQVQPFGTLRPFGTAKVNTYFDGVIDELKVYARTLGAAEILDMYKKSSPSEFPQLPERKLPTGPSGPTRFGAYYTTLKYYDAWDSHWRVGDYADVVVRFDENPCRFVFWRGTSYIPHWVTENGIWYDNEFTETWGERGCHEPMSDKQCRHSQVRIIESNDARVVVHWRYALVDNWYDFARVDESTGWGDWTDEVYTIYPDGVGVRKITLHSTNPEAPHEWHEGIVVMGPGQRPEDVLEPGALTMINMQGEYHTYSWQNGVPEPPTEPSNANIQLINTKSEFKPFIAVSSNSEPEFDIYSGELRRDVSMFPWWNHWPTAFDPSDGRYAMDSDRASHSSLTHCHWNAYQQTENSMTKIMLNGMTSESPEEISCIVKSWDAPPQMAAATDGFFVDGYDPTERAYLIRRTTANEQADLTLQIDASESSPIANLAIVIEDWNDADAAVTVDGNPANVRVGYRTSLKGSDLILWIEHNATSPTLIQIKPKI